jgi:hypothetical protein
MVPILPPAGWTGREKPSQPGRDPPPMIQASSQPPHTPLCRSAASHARSRTGLLDPKPRPLPRWLKFAEPNQKTFHFKAPVTWQRIEQGAETKSKPCRFQSPREIQIQSTASTKTPQSRHRPPRLLLSLFPGSGLPADSTSSRSSLASVACTASSSYGCAEFSSHGFEPGEEGVIIGKEAVAGGV